MFTAFSFRKPFHFRSRRRASCGRVLNLGETAGIRAGSGQLPHPSRNRWSSVERSRNRLAATVGDTLRIVNDAFVAHRLHTHGAPFPHPEADFSSQQSMDFLLTSPYDSAADGPLSDHLFGPGAQFFINVQRVA